MNVDIDEVIHKEKLKNARNEKNYMGFLTHKIWQILKHLSRALS